MPFPDQLSTARLGLDRPCTDDLPELQAVIGDLDRAGLSHVASRIQVLAPGADARG
jgi:hypothetical protein